MNAIKITLTGLISIISSIAVLFVYINFFHTDPGATDSFSVQEPIPVQFSEYTAGEGSAVKLPADFSFAASVSTPTVVHVKRTYTQEIRYHNPFRDFFGNDFGPQGQEQTRVSSGSGVIISKDGYIVTNNHVIQDAEDLEVTLHNKRTYKAELVGSDPATDLALIRIDEKGLPVIPFADSDESKVGEWVLAVGNPFDLASTVTAGIISAKARNINILSQNSQAPIESFIQTDAAVNPGNSGGALVNTRGELIGINTAIASPTGAYAGYAFAVPSNIVKKIVSDLIDFGVVQRAYLGIGISDVDSKLANDLGMENIQGVHVGSVSEDGAADAAGIEKGDVITKVNDVEVGSTSELQEQVSRYRPGDEITVTYLRKGKEITRTTTLKNKSNTTDVVEKVSRDVVAALGAEFEALDENEARKYKVKGGVKITELGEGKLAQSNIRKGFVITKIDRETVSSAAHVEKVLQKKKEGDGVMIEGFYPRYPGKTYYYAFGI